MENAGFIRTEADFAAVILADEDDHAPLRVDFVTDAVRALKPDQQAITVGAILLSCGFSVGNWRYAQFARAFGEFGATVTFAGSIPGETQTLPVAIYASLQRADGDLAAWRLALVAVLVSVGALVITEWLGRRMARGRS